MKSILQNNPSTKFKLKNLLDHLPVKYRKKHLKRDKNYLSLSTARLNKFLKINGQDTNYIGKNKTSFDSESKSRTVDRKLK